jgi:hypothetical protein
MTTTGRIAKALRKNTTCPTGTVSPSPRMSADITANSSTDTSLSRIPLSARIGGETGGESAGGGGRAIDHAGARHGTRGARMRRAG